MKICFITDDPFSVGGGPEHIRQVSRLLVRKHNYVVDVITPKIMDPNFDFFKFRQRVKYLLWTVKIFLFTDHDIYHSHSFSTCFFLPLAKLRGKKIGFTVHGLGVNIIGGGILNKTSLAQFGSQWLLNHWPFDFRLSAGKIPGFTQIGNGVDVDEFDQERSQPDARHFTILCVSRRDPVKGIEILERATKIVQRKYPRVRLHLVSGRHRTARDFKTANLYVLPSISEGFPLVILEAMAARLPIVATNVGDCREIVEKAKAGNIVAPGDAITLANQIISVVNLASSKRRKLGDNGYNFVKKHYLWDNVAQRYDQAYQSIQS